MPQDAPTPAAIIVNTTILSVVDCFTCLGSTDRVDLSLDTEINIRIVRATTTLNEPKQRVWENKNLSSKTKISVIQHCCGVTRHGLYIPWHEKRLIAFIHSLFWTNWTCRLNSFHLRSLCKILGITWKDQVPNSEELHRAGQIPTLNAEWKKTKVGRAWHGSWQNPKRPTVWPAGTRFVLGTFTKETCDLPQFPLAPGKRWLKISLAGGRLWRCQESWEEQAWVLW